MRYRRIGLTLFILVLCGNAIVQAQTPGSAANYYNHGLKLFEKGDLDGAIEDYTRAIEISSRLTPSKRDRAASWSNTNKFDSSAEADRITVIDPLTAMAYTNRGIARFRKGDIDGANADLDQAIRINPGLAEAYAARGVTRRASGDSVAALADLDRALSIDRKLAEAYNNRADIRLDSGDIEGALDDLNRALGLKPRLPETYYQLGYAQI